MTMTFKPLCPHCGTRVRIRSVKRITPKFTELYCNCANCGTSWRGAVEVMNIINAPIKTAEGTPLVEGAYTFDKDGLMVPSSEGIPPIRHSRAPSEFERMQIPLELAAGAGAGAGAG